MRVSHAPDRLEVSATLVDARGKPCPLPIIELAKALRAASPIELWADDPAAAADLEAFCQVTGHRLQQLDRGPLLRAVVVRGA